MTFAIILKDVKLEKIYFSLWRISEKSPSSKRRRQFSFHETLFGKIVVSQL